MLLMLSGGNVIKAMSVGAKVGFAIVGACLVLATAPVVLSLLALIVIAVLSDPVFLIGTVFISVFVVSVALYANSKAPYPKKRPHELR
jgi:hypothetical protein